MKGYKTYRHKFSVKCGWEKILSNIITRMEKTLGKCLKLKILLVFAGVTWRPALRGPMLSMKRTFRYTRTSLVAIERHCNNTRHVQ